MRPHQAVRALQGWRGHSFPLHGGDRSHQPVGCGGTETEIRAFVPAGVEGEAGAGAVQAL